MRDWAERVGLGVVETDCSSKDEGVSASTEVAVEGFAAAEGFGVGGI